MSAVLTEADSIALTHKVSFGAPPASLQRMNKKLDDIFVLDDDVRKMLKNFERNFAVPVAFWYPNMDVY